MISELVHASGLAEFARTYPLLAQAIATCVMVALVAGRKPG